MILRGHATLLDEMRETVAGIPKQVQASVERPILPTFPFFKHWDEFVATKKSDRKWKRDTADGAEATPRLFKALIGDLPLATIDGSVVGRFRLEYLKLPFDQFHGKKWNKLTTKQVLAAVQKLDDAAKAKLRLTSTTTANKHVINLIEYWDHLALHAKIPRGLDNPFRGHFTAKPRGRTVIPGQRAGHERKGAGLAKCSPNSQRSRPAAVAFTISMHRATAMYRLA
jgi:hypothetical protein